MVTIGSLAAEDLPINPIRCFIGENKRLANKDYLLFSTIEHLPGAATPAQIQLTI
ncbi:hypothetical protein LNP25_29780 [Klebsiella variicola subsp. variicola]|nr:hypothetical protein [Klebsiella variicola subsp. variicola]